MSQVLDGRLSRRLGTWMFARGLWAVAFGITVVFWPRVELGSKFNQAVSVRTAAVLILIYLAVHALLIVGQATRLAPLRTALLGQAIVAIPALGFLMFADTAASLRAALMVWGLLHGAVEGWLYLQLKDQRMATDFLIAAAVHVLLGLVMLIGAGLRPLAEMGFTGAAATIVGVVYAVGGWTRHTGRSTASAEEGS